MSRIIISISDLLMLLQGLLLFILRMIAMLLMPSEGLTIYHLVMTGAGSPWSGQGGNVVGIVMGPSQWQIRGRRKLCLLSTLIPFERGNGILKGILNLMEMSFMSGFGAILHSCSLKHKKKQPRPLSLQIEASWWTELFLWSML